MFRKPIIFSVVIVLSFILSACASEGVEIEVIFTTPVDDVTFLDEEGGEHGFTKTDAGYLLTGLEIGDVVVPVHENYVFSPEQSVVNATDFTHTFDVIDDTEDEGPSDDADEPDDVDGPDDADESDDIDDESDDVNGPDDTDESDDIDDESDDEDDLDITRSKTVSVSDYATFASALDDPTTRTIVLEERISGDFTIHHVIDIDLNDHTLSGDLTYDTMEEGTITLLGGVLDGTLSVDASKASIENHAHVSESIVIHALQNNSYDEYYSTNTIFIEASDVHATIHNGAEAVIIQGDAVSLHVDEAAVVGMLNIVQDASDAIIHNAFAIQHAVVENATAFFDAVPQGLSGSQTPMFEGALIESVEDIVELTFDADASTDDVLAMLPSTVSVMTEDGLVDVAVVWQSGALDLDGDNDEQQIFYLVGDFESLSDDGLVNAHGLQAFAQIVISAPETDDLILQSTFILNPVIETSLAEVDSLDAVYDLLPNTLFATYDGGSVRVDVEWTLTEGDFNNESFQHQTLEFEGVLVNIPEGYQNPNDVTASIVVEVEPLDELVSDQPFYIGSNHPEGMDVALSTDDFSENTWVGVTITLDRDFIFSHYEDYYTGEVYEPFGDPLSFSEFYDGEIFHLKAVLIPVERPDTNTLYAGGSGTESDPFLIETTEQLSNMRYYLDYEYHFMLANDLYFGDDEYFTPMRSENSHPFNGVFDGDGYTIHDYRVHIDTYDEDDPTGSFAFIRKNAGVIKDVTFADVLITSEYHGSSGLVVYHNLPGATIRDVSVTGAIEASRGTTIAYQNYGMIRDVYADVIMHDPIGGLVGSNLGTVRDSSMNGTLYITTISASGIGGVIHSNTPVDTSDNTVYDGLIDNVHGELVIRYDVEEPASSHASVSLNLGGFISSSFGASIQQPDFSFERYEATIQNSSLDIEIINDGTFNPDNIGGFIHINGGRSTLSDITVNGTIEGGRYIGGFARKNGAVATMSDITSNVDVYAPEGYAAGFVYENEAVFQNVGEIYNALSSGDVYTDEWPRSAFIVEDDGITVNSSSSGNVFAYPE